MRSSCALQFCSDGWYIEGKGGSIGIQLIALILQARHQIGYMFQSVRRARSAFEMELLGLEAALSLLVGVRYD